MTAGGTGIKNASGGEAARKHGLRGGGGKTALLKMVIFVLPFVFVFCSLFIGRYPISPDETLRALLMAIGMPVDPVDANVYTLVVSVRLPRAIAAAAVGAGLAVSGAAFQGVFRNPLVNSGLLGVSNGAAFGAALGIVLFTGTWLRYPLAFVFGILAVGLSYWIARVYKSTPTIMLILGGTIVSSVFSALVSLMKYVADADTELPSIVYWLMGSLSSVGYESFWSLIPIAVGCVILLVMSWRVNVLSMGDKEARTLGLDVRRDKLLVIAGATLSTAGAVCLAGVVGWVGLIIPHIGRMLVGNDNRVLVPVSLAIGAAFLVAIDLASRSVIASEIPLGILTALIGAPFFVYLLKKTKGGGW